ncbi:hypothetical protein RchiOBHm_Chr5g0002161 [Rosa chinensis]|uniref:Uncharacterized protein n=1 Tax=Rosa chinensis TaxID=74649 RepID=A0A2P6Q2G7_ROSCH|nr:uncharacterized protein LOC112201922 [Rosa chinensis]PRQ28354.1 hypothetical protein RchiOBHm_Chr5g0002161 [Rosa chinensis]
MTDVASRNPNLDRPAKRRVEELAEDDECKIPKQAKRRREESDEHAAGTGNSTSSDKEPPIVDDGSPLVLQQNEDKEGSGAKEDSDVEVSATEEDSDVEEVSATEEDYDSPDPYMFDNYVHEDDGRTYGYCASCVDNEVCKRCGHKDGCPAGVDPVKCFICGNSCQFTEPCPSLVLGECFEKGFMLPRSREGSGDSGYVPPAY